MQGKVAPHEGNELTLVMQGVKPAAIIDKTKQKDMFDKALELMHVVAIEPVSDTEIAVTRHEHSFLIRIIEVLGSNKANLIVGSKEEKQRMLGRILGYKQKDIDEFVKNPPDCNCRWCKYE